jgi:CRP/FNR family transcriptional regulator
MHNFSFSKNDLQLLHKNSNEISYSKGETIIKQGTFATHLLFLRMGLVKIVLEAENNKRLGVQIIPPGNYIGLTFLESDCFHFTVESIKESKLYQLKKEALYGIIESNYSVYHQLMNVYKNSYQQLLHKLEINSTRNNHGKLAHVLYTLSESSFIEEDIFRYLSRKDLAELASISKESTNRILKEFQHDRLIAINQERIEIKKPELLRRLSLIG